MRLKLLRKTANTCSAFAIILVIVLSVIHISLSTLSPQETSLSNTSAYFSIPSDHTPTNYPITALELEEEENEDDEAENNHCSSCGNKTRIHSNINLLEGNIDYYTLLKKQKSPLYFSDSSPPTPFI